MVRDLVLAIDSERVRLFGSGIEVTAAHGGLPAAARDAVDRLRRERALLTDVQENRVERRYWGDLPAGGFFLHHLLKDVVSIYYSHPAAWSEIGYGGPAGPRGYARLGFDERDPWEAKEVDLADA